VLIGHQGYDVFGAPMPAPTGPAGQPFGFTGREHELDSGLVYARARYLNPAVGRWDRPDPLGMIDGPARYGYVVNAPTLRVDPTGLFKGDIHEYVSAQAFAGILSGVDYQVFVREAAYGADGAAYQLDDYRHGMRAKGVSLADGVRAWVDFVDDELALGVVWGNSTCAETHELGLRELAYGVHAAEDYYSPPHHMLVMNWTREGIAQHSAAETGIRPESGPARQALEVAGAYAQVYQWARRFPNGDRATVRGLAWGFLGRLLFVDATTAE
jgi:RHS repeat-associated protein